MFKKEKLKVYEPPKKEKGFYFANPLWFDGDKLKEEHIPPKRNKAIW